MGRRRRRPRRWTVQDATDQRRARTRDDVRDADSSRASRRTVSDTATKLLVRAVKKIASQRQSRASYVQNLIANSSTDIDYIVILY